MAVTPIGTLMMRMGVDTRAWFGGLSKAQKGLVSFGASMQVAGLRMSTVVGGALAGLGFVALKATKDWETAFTGVRKTLEASEQQFKLLAKGFRTMAKVIPVSTTELARLGEIAGQLGIQSEDMLGFVRTMADLGVATEDLPAEEAAFKIAQMMVVMGTAQDRVGELGAVIVRLGNNLKTTEGRIVHMAERLVGAGRIIGLTESQVLALAGGMTAVGLRVEMGGTAMQRVMVAIHESVGTANKDLQTFAAVAGMTAEKFSLAWKDDAGQALLEFIAGLKDIEDSGHSVFKVLKELSFGAVRVRGALLLTSGGIDEMRKSFTLAADEVTKQTALIIEAEKRYATLESRMKILRQIFWDAAITLGEALRPAFEKVINLAVVGAKAMEGLTNWFSALDESTRILVVEVAAFVAILGPIAIGLGVIISLIAAFSGPIAIALGAITALGLGFFALRSAGISLGDVIALLGSVLIEVGLFIPRLNALWASFIVSLAELTRVAYIAARALNVLANPSSIGRFMRMTQGTDTVLNALNETLLGTHMALQEAVVDLDLAETQMAELRDVFIELAAAAKDTKGLETYKRGMETAIKTVEAALKALGDLGGPDGAIDAVRRSFKGLGDEAETEGERLAAVGQRMLAAWITEFNVEAAAQQWVRDLAASIEREAAQSRVQVTMPIDFFGGPTKTADQWRDFFGRIGGAEKQTVNWSAALRDVSRAFKLIGIEADSTIGRIVGGMIVAASAGENFGKALDSIATRVWNADKMVMETKISWEHVTLAISAAVEAVGAFLAATESASAASRALGGAMTGAQIGGALGGGWGALAGAGIGALIGALRTPGWMRRIEAIGEEWGFVIGRALAEAIGETAKYLDLGKLDAALLHLGEMIRGMGATGSLKEIQLAFTSLIAAIQVGRISAEEGLKALDDAFAALVDTFKDAGVAGAAAMGRMIALADQAGMLTQSMTDFIKSQTEAALGFLATYFDSFITELEDGTKTVTLSAREASDVLNMMGVAFAAALKSTGSLYQAILLLPDAWETLRGPLSEILGEQNELFNTIAKYYNFVADNSKVLGAIDALSQALLALLSVNALNTAGVIAFGEAFETQWEKLIVDTGDLTTSIMMMWPQLAILFRAFKELGIKVPDWLEGIIKKGTELGLSLEPPASVETILGNIQKILEAIAAWMGVIIDLGDGFGDALDPTNGGPPDGRGPPPRGGPRLLAEGLLPTVVTRPTTFTVAEGGRPELVQVTPLDGDVTGPGGGTSVHITFQGPVFGDSEDFQRAVRESVNEGLRYDYENLRTETRLAVE